MKKILITILFFAQLQSSWGGIHNIASQNQTGFDKQALAERLERLKQLKLKHQQEKLLEQEIKKLNLDDSYNDTFASNSVDERLQILQNCKSDIELKQQIKILDPSNRYDSLYPKNAHKKFGFNRYASEKRITVIDTPDIYSCKPLCVGNDPQNFKLSLFLASFGYPEEIKVNVKKNRIQYIKNKIKISQCHLQEELKFDSIAHEIPVVQGVRCNEYDKFGERCDYQNILDYEQLKNNYKELVRVVSIYDKALFRSTSKTISSWHPNGTQYTTTWSTRINPYIIAPDRYPSRDQHSLKIENVIIENVINYVKQETIKL